MSICTICQNSTGNKSFTAREMMFGYRDEFEYFECADCGCLQINELPQNIVVYYPKGYYSYKKATYIKNNILESFLRSQRTNYCLNGTNIIGMLLSRLFKPPHIFHWFKRVKIRMDSEILEVGSGVGHLLLSMHREGFLNLKGIDKYINENVFYDCGVKIYKKDISEINGQYDFIMLHHCLEHMPHPLTVFQQLYRLIRPNRYVLIRIPVASSYAWRKYGINWVQLDAPRHLYLHTIKSIQILAERVGFQIEEIVFDSTEFQFWGSEQYVNDIALRDKNSYAENPATCIFSDEQISKYKVQAIELNKNNDGDSACFYLYKS